MIQKKNQIFTSPPFLHNQVDAHLFGLDRNLICQLSRNCTSEFLLADLPGQQGKDEQKFDPMVPQGV
jgi:hypothetical protein